RDSGDVPAPRGREPGHLFRGSVLEPVRTRGAHAIVRREGLDRPLTMTLSLVARPRGLSCSGGPPSATDRPRLRLRRPLRGRASGPPARASPLDRPSRRRSLLLEHERFHDDRYHPARCDRRPDVNVVDLTKLEAVQGDEVTAELELVPQHRAECRGDVTVDC